MRTTASIEYARPAPGGNYWATSFIWGQNYRPGDSRRTNAVLAETVVPFGRRNFLTGRFEWSQRDELFEENQSLGEQVQPAFHVSSFTAGYTRDVQLFRNIETGIGANVTAYAIASALKPFYGEHPWGVNFFFRVRLRPTKAR